MDMFKQLLTVDAGGDADGVEIGFNQPTTASAKLDLTSSLCIGTHASSLIFDLAIGLADRPSI